MSAQLTAVWRGRRYKETRTLIMSESAYDWREKGKLRRAKADHAITSVEAAIEKPCCYRPQSYFPRMTDVLCKLSGNSGDTAALRRRAWDDFAYAIYVPDSVGEGAGRPTTTMWRKARDQFLDRIEFIKPVPRKIIVTGSVTWSKMPPTCVMLTDELQAYELGNGELVWCLALYHPMARSKGWVRPEEVRHKISAFLKKSLPLKG